jgi:hypothetical protein
MQEGKATTSKRGMDRVAAFSLLTPLVVMVVGAIFLVGAMGGSIAWIFASWILNLPLLAALIVAIRGAAKGSSHFRRRRLLCFLSLLMSVPLTILFAKTPLEIWWEDSFHLLPNPAHSSGTRAEFHYGKTHRVIHDPHDQLRFCFGAPPDDCHIEDGVRVLVFASHASIVKTWVDGYEVTPGCIRFGGWMGAYLTETEIWIDAEGALDQDKSLPPL